MKRPGDMKSAGIVAAAVLMISVLLSGCGLIPKIDLNTSNRTKETPEKTSTEIISSVESSSAADVSETEEELLGLFDQIKKDNEEMKAALFRYFEEAYDQYVQLADVDLSDVADLQSEACVKLEEEVRNAVKERKALIESGQSSKPEKLPYRLSILGQVSQTEDLDGNKYGGYRFDLMPLQERTGGKYEDYLKQYPSFLHFGVNQLYLHKVNGKWKVFDTEPLFPSMYPGSDKMQTAIAAYYEAAWEQYLKLEFTGLQDVFDETAPGYEEAEKLLKDSIESWKKAMEKDPGKGMPRRLAYEIHLNDKILRPSDHLLDSLYAVKCFTLLPTEDYEEGMTESEYRSAYPAFMKFGENCFQLYRFEEYSAPWIIQDLDPKDITVYEEGTP